MAFIQKAKNTVKKILPASASQRLSRLLHRKSGYDLLREEIGSLRGEAASLRREMEKDRLAVRREITDEWQAFSAELSSAMQTLTAELTGSEQKTEAVRARAEAAALSAAETEWAAIFNNTVTGSAWLKDPSFSPGRWAAGYPMLYIMYRVLNETRPRSILELGLGQTTKMISQYAAAYPEVRHTVVEHDGDWIAFYKNAEDVPANTEFVRLDRTFVPYKEAEAVRVFDGFAETFAGRGFDMIVIDAPFGGDMKQYSRIDLLFLLPGCLCDRFVIIMDDTERAGEKNTVSEIERILRGNGIEYARGIYSGKKTTTLITDKKDRFLASL